MKTAKTKGSAEYSFVTAEDVKESLKLYRCFEYIRENIRYEAHYEHIGKAEISIWVAKYSGNDKNIVAEKEHQLYFVLSDDTQRLEYNRPYYVFQTLTELLSAATIVKESKTPKEYIGKLKGVLCIVIGREIAGGRFPASLVEHFMAHTDVHLKTQEHKILFTEEHDGN